MTTSTNVLLGMLSVSIVLAIAMRFYRSKRFSIFLGVILTLHSISVSLNFYPIVPLPLFVLLNALSYIHYITLANAKLRGSAWRLLVTWPASWFSSSTIFFLPFTFLTFYVDRRLPLLAMVICAIGFIQSMRTPREFVYFNTKDGGDDAKLRRVPCKRLSVPHIADAKPDKRTLRLAQITDAHLGPFMSKHRLRKVCEQIVQWQPDFVILTGDFITMESYHAKEDFVFGLEPLRSLKGKTIACMGNHDYEAQATVEEMLTECGVCLLKDQEIVLNTRVGRVQLVGTEFSWKNAREHILKVCQLFPRPSADTIRLFLVHNPAEFVHFPSGEADLVFSGHTHGGQFGLVSLGLNWTIFGAITKTPDHGLWGAGKNRLYTHRGTGHYGFPLRIGVPSELSLLTVDFD